MRFVKDKVCATCEKGKQTKSTFKPKVCFSISDPLHLLYTYLFGPVPVHSCACKMYSLVITDEFSRFTCVIFLQKKNDSIDEIISLIK